MKSHLLPLLLVFLGLAPVLRAQAPTPACHAATIAEPTPGRLLAARFGGSYEGAKDVGIGMSEHRGVDWAPPVEVVRPLVVSGDTPPCWNPSRDKPVEPEAGVILSGSSAEDPQTNACRVYVERYYEATDTWERVEVPNPAGFEILQPTFPIHSSDTVEMLCRSKEGHPVSSHAPDRGATRSAAEATGIVNSNSGVDALVSGRASFLLVNNPLPLVERSQSPRRGVQTAKAERSATRPSSGP